MSTAIAVNFSSERMELLLDEMLGQLDDVIESVSGLLPEDFPGDIAQAVFQGMKSMRDRLVVKNNNSQV